MSGYSGGRVVRIKLQNFLTYDDIEIFPSSGLNLIVGLNGTGKSSIVCGICLCLNGKPQFTGRATEISDYIKHGCQDATIELELENTVSSNVIINRKIYQHNKKSLWTLNGNTVQANVITDTVKRFNIQTNNLCQFLPQERVAEFSKMDKKQRLENMLQAIGEQNLYILFNELKELKTKCCLIEKEILNLKNHILTEEQTNQRLETEVIKYDERLRLLDEIKILQDKKTVALYHEKRGEHAIQKINRDKLEAEKETCSQQLAKARSCMESLMSMYSEWYEKIQNEDKIVLTLMEKIQKKISKLDVLNEKNLEVKMELNNKIEEKKNQKKRLQDLKQQVMGLQKSYKDCEEQIKQNQLELPDIKAQMQVVQNDISRESGHEQTVFLQINDLNMKAKDIKKEMDHLQNENNKRMDILRSRDNHAYQAALWLQDNKDKFKGTVYPPIFTLIKVKDEANVKYIENHISYNDMMAFVCENSDDSKLLVKILREEKKYAIMTVMAPKTHFSAYTPQYTIEQLKKHGFNCFLRDLFTAPDAVMSYLCDIHNVHTIPVGDEYTENKIKIFHL